MENFILHNPTKLVFGKNVISGLPMAVKEFGNKVLLVYGKGSVKKSGIYDSIIDTLKGANIEIVEYAGIKSNPVVEDVESAAQLAREQKIDLIIALGGGSVIDSAKIISITAPSKNKAWDYYLGNAKPVSALPVIAILTIAATGSEMNAIAVLQNNTTMQKLGYSHKLCYPKYSYLNPEFTYTVTAQYTAYGITDLIAHALEAYFGHGTAELTDKFIVSIIKEAMEFAPALLKDLNNYDLRARMMYAATCALNGMTIIGKTSGDWGVHSMGHILSLMYDLPHGASLSIAYPAWLKLQKNRITGRLEQLGIDLFNNDNPDTLIAYLEAFFVSINCPVRLSQAVDNPDKNDLLKIMKQNNVSGFCHKLQHSDYEKIVELYS